MPACVQSAPETPSFVLRYPRPGLPALVAAGDAINAQVRLPAALTPPPGVQQRRALEGWRAELVGHARALAPARALEHRYVLEVTDVRPLGPSSLTYRVRLEAPAWIAPGSYDLALAGPGGSARVAGAVRVLARGRAPRLAWLGPRAQLTSPAAASLPVDVFVSTALPAAALASAAPVLVLEGAAALRVGRELLVLGECATEYLSFADEVRGIRTREGRSLRAAPEPPALEPGTFRRWGEDTVLALPQNTDLSVAQLGSELQVQVAPSFPGRAELALLFPVDGRATAIVHAGPVEGCPELSTVPVNERGEPARSAAGVELGSQPPPKSSDCVSERPQRPAREPTRGLRGTDGDALAFFPASARLTRSPRSALVGLLSAPAPGITLRRRAERALWGRLQLKPERVVVLEPVSMMAPGAPGGSQLALQVDPLTTYFANAEVKHRFGAVAQHRLRGWLVARDGRVAVLERSVAVHGRLAIGCTVVDGGKPALGWAALVLVLAASALRALARGTPALRAARGCAADIVRPARLRYASPLPARNPRRGGLSVVHD